MNNNIEITYSVRIKTDVAGEIVFSKTLRGVNEIDPDLWQNTAPIAKSLGPDDCGGQNSVFAAQELMRSMSADLYRAVKILSNDQEYEPDHAIGVYLADDRLGATPVGEESMFGCRIDPDIIIGIKVDIDPDDIRDLDANPCHISGI